MYMHIFFQYIIFFVHISTFAIIIYKTNFNITRIEMKTLNFIFLFNNALPMLFTKESKYFMT